MTLCPRCGSPHLIQTLQMDVLHGSMKAQMWECPRSNKGCGWSGQFPNRTKGSLLLASEMKGLRVKKFSEAQKSLQASGDLMLVKHPDGTKEVVS